MGPVPTAGASDGPVAAPWWLTVCSLHGAGLRAVKYKLVVIVTQSSRSWQMLKKNKQTSKLCRTQKIQCWHGHVHLLRKSHTALSMQLHIALPPAAAAPQDGYTWSLLLWWHCMKWFPSGLELFPYCHRSIPGLQPLFPPISTVQTLYELYKMNTKFM